MRPVSDFLIMQLSNSRALVEIFYQCRLKKWERSVIIYTEINVYYN